MEINSSDSAQRGLNTSLFLFGKGRSLLIRPGRAQILTRLTVYKLRRLNGVICFRIWVDGVRPHRDRPYLASSIYVSCFSPTWLTIQERLRLRSIASHLCSVFSGLFVSENCTRNSDQGQREHVKMSRDQEVPKDRGVMKRS